MSVTHGAQGVSLRGATLALQKRLPYRVEQRALASRIALEGGAEAPLRAEARATIRPAVGLAVVSGVIVGFGAAILGNMRGRLPGLEPVGYVLCLFSIVSILNKRKPSCMSTDLS